MNQHRFDLIARRLAAARDRRSLLGAAISVLAFHGSPRAVFVQEPCPGGCAEDEICTDRGCGTPCTRHPDCRDKFTDPCVATRCSDGICVAAIIECLPGSVCCKGECCATTCELDADCAAFDPCLWGRCGVDGRCEFTELDPCVICSSDEECLGDGQSSVCCDGACRRACPTGTVMGKGCECHALGAASRDNVVVRDDASG